VQPTGIQLETTVTDGGQSVQKIQDITVDVQAVADKIINQNAKIKSAKLVNKNFVDKAPAAVVEKERARLAEMTKSIEQLQEQLGKIKAL
jgi:valyl-tRNA synthetase